MSVLKCPGVMFGCDRVLPEIGTLELFGVDDITELEGNVSIFPVCVVELAGQVPARKLVLVEEQ